MIVVCSIHQPRSNIFSVFDKVLLLDKGKTVFYGARKSIAKYFESVGEVERRCPRDNAVHVPTLSIGQVVVATRQQTSTAGQRRSPL